MTRPNGHAVAKIPHEDFGALEAAVINGDLSKLTEDQRMSYYYMRCRAAGLDPRSRPFHYVQFEGRGKLELYATKAASDQLIANRHISVKPIRRTHNEKTGIYEVTACATLPDGQANEDDGIVYVGDLRGQALANAMMKAVTKAKRRSVLGVCGLGMLDETEVETIPGARTIPAEVQPEPPATADVKRLDPPAEPASPPRGECSLWIQERIDDLENEWAMMCVQARKPHKKIGINTWQVINGLITRWIESGILPAETVETQGKRDKAKVKDVIKVQWETDREDFRDELTEYLRGKFEAAAREAGINLDAEPTEDTADASQLTT